jgi:pyrroloquinoline quinone (PQQ) biosynthesis protein C
MAVATGVLSRQEFEAELDEDIRRRHPFIHHRWPQLLFAGKLSREQLQDFAFEFEHFLRATPRHFFCLGANALDVIPDDDDLRRSFAENLNDDMGVTEREKDHFQIFRRFAYAVGLSVEQLEASRPLPSTNAFNLGLMYLAKDLPIWEGMAAVSWANEGLFTLGLTALWERALATHYGLRRDQIFLPPAAEEAAHVRLPREYILDYAETERTQRRIRDVFQLTFDLWTVFFDGVDAARARTA